LTETYFIKKNFSYMCYKIPSGLFSMNCR